VPLLTIRTSLGANSLYEHAFASAFFIASNLELSNEQSSIELQTANKSPAIYYASFLAFGLGSSVAYPRIMFATLDTA